MKPILLVGIVLIILGIVALTYQGITYTTREKVLQIGPSKPPKRLKEPSPCHLFWAGSHLEPGLY